LYFRPLPHQHASLAAGSTEGGWVGALLTQIRLRDEKTVNHLKRDIARPREPAILSKGK
jgi:hypothetical protein